MGLLEAHAGLNGKFAAVLGGASGYIGRAVTLGLAKAGVRVAACDNDEPATHAIVKDVEALGQKMTSVFADVCDVDAQERFYDRVEKEFGRLDIIVNVAGGVQR